MINIGVLMIYVIYVAFFKHSQGLRCKFMIFKIAIYIYILNEHEYVTGFVIYNHNNTLYLNLVEV